MLQIAPHNASPTSSTSSTPVEQQVSLLALLTCVLRARRLIVRCAVATAAVVAVTLTTPSKYVSTASVTVQGGRAASSLSGLAAQFGVNVGGGDAIASPAFVAKLLGAPELLRRLAVDTLRSADAAPIAVASLYEGPAGESRAQQMDRVATALAKDLRVAAEVVEPASLPSIAEPRGLLSKLVLGGAGGAILGACIGLFLASLARQASADRSTGSEFSGEPKEAWSDLTHPWRLVKTSPAPAQPDSRAA